MAACFVYAGTTNNIFSACMFDCFLWIGWLGRAPHFFVFRIGRPIPRRVLLIVNGNENDGL